MDPLKNRKPSVAQVAALVAFMEKHTDVAKGLVHSGLNRVDLEAYWSNLTETLNSMEGPVKPVDKWKQTWRDLKSNTKKRALKHQQPNQCDTSMGPSTDFSHGAEVSTDGENYVPPDKKRFASFDDEIIRIEREKLELDREYKAQKIEVLSRIASALEGLSRKKDKT